MTHITKHLVQNLELKRVHAATLPLLQAEVLFSLMEAMLAVKF